MKLYIVLATLMIIALAACGGNTETSGVIEPAANAPVIVPDAYLTSYAETDHFLLDVRTDAEVSRGVISGATHIPLDQLASRVSEIPADQTVVVYCNSGNRSRSAVDILNSAGYNQLLDLQGVQQWTRSGQQLVPLGN